jgi:predicted NBD/HSP70 family sugar kinase
MDKLTEPGTRTMGRLLGRQQVLGALGALGSATRVELARETGLSRSAIASIVGDLEAESAIDALGDTDAPRSPGRPATRLALSRPSGAVVGIDLGNTHLRVAVARAARLEILTEQNLRIEAGSSPFAALDQATAMTLEAVESCGLTMSDVRAAALGVPAPLWRVTHQVATNNIRPVWVDVDPGVELGERLGVDVVVENDANLGALGEWRMGAARGHDVLLYVKVATGIGAGLVLDGRMFRGADGIAGEIGHVQVDPDGSVCRCGARGCLETVVSIEGIGTALEPVAGVPLDLRGVRQMLADDHAGATRVVADAGRTIGRVLAQSCTLLNPSRIVVGGPLGDANDLLAQHIAEAIRQFAQPAAASRVTVGPAELGERAEVVGALCLAGDVAQQHHLSSLWQSVGAVSWTMPALAVTP